MAAGDIHYTSTFHVTATFNEIIANWVRIKKIISDHLGLVTSIPELRSTMVIKAIFLCSVT